MCLLPITLRPATTRIAAAEASEPTATPAAGSSHHVTENHAGKESCAAAPAPAAAHPANQPHDQKEPADQQRPGNRAPARRTPAAALRRLHAQVDGFFLVMR